MDNDAVTACGDSTCGVSSNNGSRYGGGAGGSGSDSSSSNGRIRSTTMAGKMVLHAVAATRTANCDHLKAACG